MVILIILLAINNKRNQLQPSTINQSINVLNILKEVFFYLQSQGIATVRSTFSFSLEFMSASEENLKYF